MARIYGYNNIPNLKPAASLAMVEQAEGQVTLKRVRDLLVDRGFQEAITYSFVDPKTQQTLFPQSDAIVLPNPISVEMSAMRVSVPGSGAGGGLQPESSAAACACSSRACVSSRTRNAENGIRQESMLAGIITGNQGTSTGMPRPVPSTSSI